MKKKKIFTESAPLPAIYIITYVYVVIKLFTMEWLLLAIISLNQIEQLDKVVRRCHICMMFLRLRSVIFTGVDSFCVNLTIVRISDLGAADVIRSTYTSTHCDQIFRICEGGGPRSEDPPRNLHCLQKVFPYLLVFML